MQVKAVTVGPGLCSSSSSAAVVVVVAAAAYSASVNKQRGTSQKGRGAFEGHVSGATGCSRLGGWPGREGYHGEAFFLFFFFAWVLFWAVGMRAHCCCCKAVGRGLALYGTGLHNRRKT